MYDPKSEARTWQEWNDFEVELGNEDTFREMLRIKRAVKAQYAAVSAVTVADPTTGTRAAGGSGAAVGIAAAGYIPSDAWRGIQRGHVFKKGPLGLGYYSDDLAARSQPLAADAVPPPPPSTAALDAIAEEPVASVERSHDDPDDADADAGAHAARRERRVALSGGRLAYARSSCGARAYPLSPLAARARHRREHRAEASTGRCLRLGRRARREAPSGRRADGRTRALQARKMMRPWQAGRGGLSGHAARQSD